EPDVLQYYKNPQARRPIRTINLNLCEQVDAGLSFTKKELESNFVFDLRTEERVWYLVAESEEDMNRWVSSICLLCGFNPTDDGKIAHRALHVLPLLPHDRAALSGPQQSLPSVSVSVPPPYDPVSVRTAHPNVEHHPGEEEEEYLWLSNCPAPAHMGFRTTPATPPPRGNPTSPGGEPPPIHRNLKPRKVQQQDWQEVPPPVRSPVTRTFTRELMLHRSSEGGVSCSPLLRRHKAKQVEYLDLDLHTGRTTPTRQVRKQRARGERARVDYVVVDPKRTKALRNTREAWHDGRMSTDKEKA
uniref:PH domain-containing protein n=1 Tax=Neogobius melanostomus TaxID=47308 RepID=A0A8C6S886_9GOBI